MLAAKVLLSSTTDSENKNEETNNIEEINNMKTKKKGSFL
jgi:hypothetical protein